MKKTKFTEEKIVYALKLTEGGTSMVNVCRTYRISDATFCIWRKRYGAGCPGVASPSLVGGGVTCPRTSVHLFKRIHNGGVSGRQRPH